MMPEPRQETIRLLVGAKETANKQRSLFKFYSDIKWDTSFSF